jgi:diguanylate cyclase (GGDEF)-like protein/PAS domain S-box-containing protein
MEHSIIDSIESVEILAVDDTAESLAYLCEILCDQGYTVRAAPDGELALWSARSKPPDLILLDVRMPGMNGFEVCRRLKADPQTAAVPVIFLSALSDIDDKVHGFQAGGVDYVAKPFSPEEVLQRVATHVRLAQMTRALERKRSSLAERVRERTAELQKTADDLRLVASAFEASFSGMLITDIQGDILAVNAAFTSTTGYTPEECVGLNASLLKSDRHDTAYFQKMWQIISTEGKWTGEIWNRRKDANVFPCLLSISSVRDQAGHITHFVGVLNDLSEIRDAQTLIDFLTQHDALTGLPNRVIVQDRFTQLVAGLQDDEVISVICMDLDRFRQINDLHGHDFGNEMLRWVAEQLGELMPAVDTVFRQSGDEFVLIHRGQRALLDVHLLIDEIHRYINVGHPVGDTEVKLSVSLGVAIYPMDGACLEELLANAALALQRVKEKGGGASTFFAEDIDQGMRVRYDIAQRLRKAVSHGEFRVYFQPQVDVASSRIVGAEALLRWQSPELGFVSPGVFIPVAEESGCILDLGEWVLNTVCAQIATWRAEGLGDIKVAVNLSARQFMQRDISAKVAHALQNSGIPVDCLELEITESALVDDVQEAIATMQALKELGVSIALDDFGTGYSSLSYLKKFPVDYLKVDQSFVRDLITDTDADAIVCSIIGLAHNMRMQVIAEGVETDEQKQYLEAHGCDLLQGYLLGKPMPADQFGAFFKSNRAEA